MTDNRERKDRPAKIQDMMDLNFLSNSGLSPRNILEFLYPKVVLPPDMDDAKIMSIILMLQGPPKRDKLPQYNTLEDAVELIKRSKKIIVLSGAGISTSAGLPDFRSRNGIYKQIHQLYPDLHDPKSMFEINFFKKNPKPFFHFAKALFPGQYKPTIGHKFIKCVEEHGKLLNNYTQNIDTLEKQAGIKRVIECHGSFSRATCTSCKYSLDGEYLKKDIFSCKIPICPLCHTSDDGPQDGLGIMKPNIVFFGESLGEAYHDTMERDKDQADLLIVIGSSLKVRPVAMMPFIIPADVPQILINREPLDYFNFDIELYGNCDEIIQEICHRLGDKWTEICLPNTKHLKMIIGPDEVKISERFDEERLFGKTSPSGACSSSQSESRKRAVGGSQENQTGDNLNDTDVVETSQDEESLNVDIERGDTNSSSEVASPDELESDEDLPEKIDFSLPDKSFIFIQPNMYLFNGAEMTKRQYIKRVKGQTVV